MLIGGKEYTIEERLFAASGNIAALNYCKHEYVEYNGAFYFYDAFYTKLLQSINGRKICIGEIPYLGVLYLEQFLRSNGLKIVTFNNFDLDLLEIDKMIRNCMVPIVAISTTFFTSPIPIIRMVQHIKKNNRDIKIIVGGAYIYNQYLSLAWDKLILELKLMASDFYICDPQGEKTLYEIINEILGNAKCDANNLIRMADANKIFQTKRIDVEHNDININIVRVDQIEDRLIRSPFNIRTSRGCPNRCMFCNYPVRNPKWEVQDIEKVFIQIKALNEDRRINSVVFIDDSFNVPLSRFKEICRYMVSLGYIKTWYSYFRLDYCDEETAALMKASGCGGVFLGIESADNTILKYMNKQTTIEIYERSLSYLNKYEIPTFGYFIVGFPGETKESVNRTIEFINRNRLTFYSCNLWFAEKETAIFASKDKYGLEGAGFDWSHNTMDSIEASELMGYMYINVKDSVYVPGENFSFWGVPYLIDKGLTLSDVKSLLQYTRDFIVLSRFHEGSTNETKDKVMGKIKHVLEKVQ